MGTPPAVRPPGISGRSSRRPSRAIPIVNPNDSSSQAVTTKNDPALSTKARDPPDALNGTDDIPPNTGSFAQPATVISASTPVRLEQLPIHPRPRSDQGSSFQPSSTMDLNRRDVMSAAAASQSPGTPYSATLQRPLIAQDDGSEIDRAFNVYASPFVQKILKEINADRPQQTFATPPLRAMDLSRYAVSGASIASHLPGPVPPGQLTSDELRNLGALSQAHYEAYFTVHLDREYSSQKQRNESLALYEHELKIVDTHDPAGLTWRLQVPGLRENSPLIEEDDVIELRELVYDHYGRLSFSASMHWPQRLYRARVVSVLRAKQQLTITAHGFQPANILNTGAPWRFNVQFPVAEHRLWPLYAVLPGVQLSLKIALGTTSQQLINDSSPFPRIGTYWFQSMLFPTSADCAEQSKLNSGSFTSPFIDNELNYEQKRAVESICKQNYGTLPFLISGPPGTGKTKTLIETALQLVENVRNVSHLLVVAPSDPAADTLAMRLRPHLRNHELLRLNRPSRTFAEVPAALLPYCFSHGNVFQMPDFKALMRYKIVVTTCKDAGMLVQARVTNSDLYAMEKGIRSDIHPAAPPTPPKQLHWTALLIDEAAQAIEPEALVPMSVVSPPVECDELDFVPLVVMAGDQHQLGPYTSLPHTPLGQSLFARLFERQVYADHKLARSKMGEAPPPLTRQMLPILRPPFSNLIRNYRSHPAILAIPSQRFYHDTLEPEAPPQEINQLAHWQHWKGRGWPVLLHENFGRDELELEGSGWYNDSEARIACQYAARFVRQGQFRQEEVCIMSPFKAQVLRLRKLMQSSEFGLWSVNIGPTEAFQGLEKGVVILCTTRSKTQWVDKDVERGWGIIRLPHKGMMNVALTRARFGLIVIGKREVLSLDEDWKALVSFCDRNGLVATTGGPGGRSVAEWESSLDTDQREEWKAPAIGHRNETNAVIPQLERIMVAQEDYWENGHDQTRVMGGRDQEDEMWTTQSHYEAEDLVHFAEGDGDDGEL